MNSKIKKSLCVVLAVLIISAVVFIIFYIPYAERAYKSYSYWTSYENYPPNAEIYLKELIVWIGAIAFASLTILSNGFLLFTFLRNSNFLEYVKMNANELAESRKKKGVEKQEKKKQKLQSKLNEIDQKTV